MMTIIEGILTLLILIVLFFSSKEDLRYHRISKRYVLITLLLVLFYTMFHPTYGIERTVSFIIAFGIFSGFTFLTRGGFGFGDTIIISAIALYIGNTHQLATFLQLLGFTTLIWGTYCILTTYKRQGKTELFKNSFRIIDTVPIDKVIPGMILANDYFMEGLKEYEIEDLKKKGFLTLKIKYAYPYIPVIFFSFLIYVIVQQRFF